MMTYIIRQHIGLVLVSMIAIVLACAPIHTAQASSHDQIEHAIDNVVSQILLANSVGNDAQVAQLFTVLFELLFLEGYTPDGGLSADGLDLEDLDIRNIKDDEAEVQVDVDWGGAEDAWIWFEYGEDEDDLEYETSRERIDEDDDEFEGTLEELDEDERYYVRAVAEDRDTSDMYESEIESFRTDDKHSDDDEPELDIQEADDVEEDSAEITGEVDMNDFRNGLVFFVWGEDEDQVEDIERDYDEYRDIDEDGNDLQVRQVDNDLDDDREYTTNLDNLDENTRHYFGICVEYEDEDDDETIKCSDIEHFRTGDDDNDEEPEAEFEDVDDITDDSAELNGSVDMNDFRNGLVFFVWGEDEDKVEDIERDHDEYRDIDEDGGDLQKHRVDSDLDDDEEYSYEVDNLEDDTRYYARICVEYEDEDDDEAIVCSDTEDFRTDD